MTIEQIYTGCLAQGAYYLESKGEALVIDPLREPAPYVARAKKSNAKIKYVLETHFHADFVSGHVDLAKETGAQIVYGPGATASFPFYAAKDGERLPLGELSIEVLHTPGHTMESTCYLLRGPDDKPVALFSGDTLFVGDVGRPDLAQKIAIELTPEKLAGHLFDSLRRKIMPLPDDVTVYPAHGAGSACGKHMSKEMSDTLGHQKQTNYALNPNLSREQFTTAVIDGLLPPPGYFPKNVMMNKQGYDTFGDVLKQGLRPFKPEAFETVASLSGALVLDTRDPGVFCRGFIPNSINIGVDGSFAPWVGTMVPDVTQPLLIVCEQGREEEVVTRLSRVGFDHTLGYLEGGFAAWIAAGREADVIHSVDMPELEDKASAAALNILDVRKPGEYESGHVIGAVNIPLEYVNENLAAIDQDKTYHVYCGTGYRSMIFVSILRARGYENLIDVSGGIKAIRERGYLSISDYVCPSGV